MHKLLLFFFFISCNAMALAGQAEGEEQQKHFIYFTDKANSPYSLQEPGKFLSSKALKRRARQNIGLTYRDLPVTPRYVEALKQLDVEVWYTSRWFNGAVVLCSRQKLAEIEVLPFVRASQNLNRVAGDQTVQQQSVLFDSNSNALIADLQPKAYGPALHQANMLGAVDLHAAGYNGEGITIAVLDTGFPAVDRLPAFAHLFQNGQLKGTFDFVSKNVNVFAGGSAHGTAVLSTMAAYDPGRLIGTAYAADYYLFRTEDVASEHNIEEINWLLAAEYADSVGVDIINSSLGYTTFDPPSESYTYNQLDGNTALVTKAADFAAATGMLIVVSAGNAGASTWRYLSAPADADSVLTVGAVDSLGVRAGFSSFGPTADGRIKPDVVGLGQRAYVINSSGQLVRSNGTSFSGPIVAGMAACLWQAKYEKSNMQMLQLLRQVGSNADNPNNEIGYGIPNFAAAVPLPRKPKQHDVIISNPIVNNELSLTLGGAFRQEQATVYIFDTAGRLIVKQQVPAGNYQYTLQLPQQALKQGVYLCRVTAGQYSVAVRVVKL